MQILSTIERDALIKTLSTAPDELLLNAVQHVKDWRTGIQRDMKELQSFVGLRVIEAQPAKYSGTGVAAPVTERPEPAASVAAPASRTDKSPGPSGIGKIGTTTKEMLLAILGKGEQPTKGRWDEHLKLLWQRHEIKYDGNEYYV